MLQAGMASDEQPFLTDALKTADGVQNNGRLALARPARTTRLRVTMPSRPTYPRRTGNRQHHLQQAENQQYGDAGLRHPDRCRRTPGQRNPRRCQQFGYPVQQEPAARRDPGCPARRWRHVPRQRPIRPCSTSAPKRLATMSIWCSRGQEATASRSTLNKSSATSKAPFLWQTAAQHARWTRLPTGWSTPAAPAKWHR